MDTSTSCNSTSTSAPVQLDLRLLDRRSHSPWTCLAYELLSCRFGQFRLHTSLWLRALIRSWQGVYVCKFRSTRTRFQFKKTLPGEHSPENFCCVGPHFQACMNLSDVFCLRCFSEARKKHFRRNFRKCSRMRAIVFAGDLEDDVEVLCVSINRTGGVARAEFSTDVTFSHWFCFLINACSSLRSLLCLLERNTALHGKIQGNLGDFDAQNDVSV